MENIVAMPCTRTTIARQGEHGVTAIHFQVADMLALGEGSFELWFRRPDGRKAPEVVTLKGTELLWTPEAGDTFVDGFASAEIRYFIGGNLAISRTYPLKIAKSMIEPGSDPDPETPWVEQVHQYAEQAKAASQAIQNMSVTAATGGETTVEKQVDPDTGTVTLAFTFPTPGGGQWVIAERADAAEKVLINTNGHQKPALGEGFLIIWAEGNTAKQLTVSFYKSEDVTIINPDPKNLKYEVRQGAEPQKYPVVIAGGTDAPVFEGDLVTTGAIFGDGRVQILDAPGQGGGVTAEYVNAGDEATLTTAQKYTDTKTTDQKPKDFPVQITKTSTGYNANKTYREVQQAFAQGRDVYMLYEGARYDFASKSEGPSPYFRFARTSIGGGIATERKFVYRLSSTTVVLEYEEHSTYLQVMSVTVTGTNGSYTASKTSAEIEAFCNPGKNSGLASLYYPGGGTNPDEILQYSGYAGQSKEAVFHKAFPSGRTLFAYVGETGAIRTQWFTPPSGTKFVITKNDPPDGRFKSSTWENIRKWAVAESQPWYNTEIDGVDLLKKDDVVWMPLLAKDDAYVPDRIVYIIGQVTAADASSCAITGYGVINDAGGMQDVLTKLASSTAAALPAIVPAGLPSDTVPNVQAVIDAIAAKLATIIK